MNKKLVKRVAVASLAALMTIPSLTTTSYAISQATIENWEMNAKKAEAKGNYAKAKEYRDAIAEGLKKDAERNAKNAQIQAQSQAVQAEKDRIANTVYPLTAKYVKDFVPAVDDYQPHFYERPELPGVIFTLQQDSFGRLTDVKPNIKWEKLEDFHRESQPYDRPELKFDDTCETIKVTYISPFNCVISAPSIGDFRCLADRNGFAGEWCHWIGENRTVIMDRVINMHYKSGWPDYYIGKQVNEINQSNMDPAYGCYPESHFGQITLQEAISKAKVIFNTKERVDQNKRRDVNYAVGAYWIYEQDIYSVAGEHETD